jgi:hypothetical protein
MLYALPNPKQQISGFQVSEKEAQGLKPETFVSLICNFHYFSSPNKIKY